MSKKEETVKVIETKEESKFVKRYNYETVDILGTTYKIYVVNKEDDNRMRENGTLVGYCNPLKCEIVIQNVLNNPNCRSLSRMDSSDIYMKLNLRHEIVHAFLFESGLSDCTFQYNDAWARNEEMVDWLAIQIPKINKVYETLDLL